MLFLAGLPPVAVLEFAERERDGGEVRGEVAELATVWNAFVSL
jgi:hypothetical protein